MGQITFRCLFLDSTKEYRILLFLHWNWFFNFRHRHILRERHLFWITFVLLHFLALMTDRLVDFLTKSKSDVCFYKWALTNKFLLEILHISGIGCGKFKLEVSCSSGKWILRSWFSSVCFITCILPSRIYFLFQYYIVHRQLTHNLLEGIHH